LPDRKIGRPIKATVEQVWEKYNELNQSKRDTAKALDISIDTVKKKLTAYYNKNRVVSVSPPVPDRIEPNISGNSPSVSASTEQNINASEILTVETAAPKSEAVEMQKGYASALPIDSGSGAGAAQPITNQPISPEIINPQRPNNPVNLDGVSLLVSGGYEAYFAKQGYSPLSASEREGIEKAINGAGEHYLPESMKKHAPIINAVTAIIAPLAKREIFEGKRLQKLGKKKVVSEVKQESPKEPEAEKPEFEKQLEAARARQAEAIRAGRI